ncbi:hypothetical protein L596_018144 [Steinernema carpocapsae]|uniref:Uncharacterized protein n=1 Tax=Steinernema carpocapsae TaxID=34508 RepID=A0A4U5N4I9_STECR|nr:hypothetical protein L596_018144 [Steinernema carpocapsae]
MPCNPCGCWRLKDGAMSVAIWSAVYGIAQMVLFGWQMSVMSNCRSVTMASSNLMCEYWCPCVGASTARTSALVEGLFVIQVICLIVSFFLLFASCALVWGVHTQSRFLIWPWFPCMISSIVMALAYCVMWWTGDVRDYWLVLTILETICAFVNIYCFVVILMYYRYMDANLEYFRRALYPPKDSYYLDTTKDTSGITYHGGPPEAYNYNQPQGYLPPYGDRRLPIYDHEPLPAKTPLPTHGVPGGGEDDWITHWVKDSQRIGLVETNSEPISPVRQDAPVMLQHARSVPSMYPEESQDRYHKRGHRSSSRRSSRRRSRSRHRSSSRHRHDSRDFSTSSISSDYTDSTRRSHRRRHRSRDRDRYTDYSGTEISEGTTECSRRHRKHRHRHEKERKKGPRQVKSRHDRDRSDRDTTLDATTENFDQQQHQGLSFPQNIIIPPSGGVLGPNGKMQPQTVGINHKITISYDQDDEQPPRFLPE